MDYLKPLESICEHMEKIGEPLTENQRISIAGALSVWLQVAYQQGITDGIHSKEIAWEQWK